MELFSKKNLIITGIIVAFASIIGVASYYFLGADNPIEEGCENMIEGQTGLDVDLSPSTSEVTK